LKPFYKEQAILRQHIFKTFDRVYTEHFTAVKDKIELKSNEQLTSNCVQSPDDLDATYLKVKQNSRVKARLFSIVVKQKN
jgi:hypothetical protein